MNKPAVQSIIAALGIQAICQSIGVSTHAVRYAKTEGVFPSSWFGNVRELSEKAGIECPLDAFNWKTAEDDSGADASDDNPPKAASATQAGDAA